jgi:hypothetical protein
VTNQQAMERRIGEAIRCAPLRVSTHMGTWSSAMAPLRDQRSTWTLAIVVQILAEKPQDDSWYVFQTLSAPQCCLASLVGQREA